MKRALLLLAAWALALAPALARVVEEQFDLPVQVVDAYGKQVAQPIRVTVFRDSGRKAPQPLLVLNHGRSYKAEARAAVGRARLSEASRFFVAQGFVVAVPTRVGYGVSGGEDVEDSGNCSRKRYAPGYAAAADQTLQLIDAMRQRPYVLGSRAVVVGQSYGGTTAIGVAARMPQGVAAAINFAGGGGGNPETRPGDPCASGQLEQLFAGYGRSARMPTLWVYTENDRYMGPTHPREWFQAFEREGGRGRFVQFPPHGEDGHLLFTRFPEVWHPVVLEFLREQGMLSEEAAP